MDAPYAKLEQLEPGIARLLAHNPSAFTYYGTQTYLLGEREAEGVRREMIHVDQIVGERNRASRLERRKHLFLAALRRP